jgi:very-short-patch-repair endonuclease
MSSKGKHWTLTPEQRARQRASFTPERRKALSILTTSRNIARRKHPKRIPLSDEERSARRKASWTPERRERKRLEMTGKKFGKRSPLVGVRISQRLKGRKPTDVNRSNQSAAQRQAWLAASHEEQTRRKCQLSLAAASRWANPAARIEQGRRLLEIRARTNGRKRRTRIETIVQAMLDTLGIDYVCQHPIGPYSIDFFVQSRALAIECDGAYWHTKPGAVEKDRKRDAYLVERGYSVLRLPEGDIKSGRFAEALRGAA